MNKLLKTALLATMISSSILPSVTTKAAEKNDTIIVNSNTSIQTKKTASINAPTNKKRVDPNSSWQVLDVEIDNNGAKWYEIGTNVWLNSVYAKEETPEQKEQNSLPQIPDLVMNNLLMNPGQQSNFIREITPYAMKVAKENNLFPSVMIAQAVIESASGTSGLSANYNNYFGIKGSFGSDSSVVMPTQEYYSASPVTIDQPFRKYADREGSFRDNAALLRNGITGNPLIYSGTWRENAQSYQDATANLQKSYATSPIYASTLNSMIERYNLNLLDN